MNHILLVALGGAIGSVCRYFVGLWAVRLLGGAFPWGTLAINVVGSLVIGALAELLVHKLGDSAAWRLLLITGLVGGFTTFSTFSLEAFTLFERGAIFSGSAYILASVGLSLLAVFVGLAAARAILG